MTYMWSFHTWQSSGYLHQEEQAGCSATTNFVHVHIHFKLNMSPIFILITWAPPLPLRLPLRLLLWVLLRQVHWCQKLYFAQLFQPMPNPSAPRLQICWTFSIFVPRILNCLGRMKSKGSQCSTVLGKLNCFWNSLFRPAFSGISES